MPENEIVTRTSRYFERTDGIITQVVTAGCKQTLDDAKENIRAFTSLTKGQKRLSFVDMRANFTTGPGVRDYYAGAEATRLCVAMAMLVGSSTSRMVGNFFLTISRPAYPCRMFTREEEAIAWLKVQRR